MEYSLEALMTRGKMTEIQALDFMFREREAAYRKGLKTVRIIVGGKVIRQWIGV